MTQNLERAGAEGTLGQIGIRRTYVKPFVRNLDVLDTESKVHLSAEVTASFMPPHGPS